MHVTWRSRNGQETQGRHRCLEQLRRHDADSFVHYLGPSGGHCELWRCVTRARLSMSAGPGGGLSAASNAIVPWLQPFDCEPKALVDEDGHYLTVDQALNKTSPNNNNSNHHNNHNNNNSNNNNSKKRKKKLFQFLSQSPHRVATWQPWRLLLSQRPSSTWRRSRVA